MSTTKTLTQTINWAQGFVNFMPLNIGTGNEPALTSANTILQTILAPPFAWRWNRAETLVDFTAAGVQDVTQNIPNFSFLEKASVLVPNQKAYELTPVPVLGDSTEQDRPQYIAIQEDDDQGNIRIRVSPAPDQPYTISLIYQLDAPLMTSVTSTWAPVPDNISYVYQWGFLSLMLDYVDSAAADRARQLFVASLLGVAEGLEEDEKNIFVQSWLGDMRDLAKNQYGAQLAAKAKGM